MADFFETNKLAFTNGSDASIVRKQASDSADSASLKKKDVPKAIFSGITRDEAEEYGLMDQFIAANTDGDETVSEDEYKTFSEKGQEPKETKQEGEQPSIQAKTAEQQQKPEETKQKSETPPKDITAKPEQETKTPEQAQTPNLPPVTVGYKQPATVGISVTGYLTKGSIEMNDEARRKLRVSVELNSQNNFIEWLTNNYMETNSELTQDEARKKAISFVNKLNLNNITSGSAANLLKNDNTYQQDSTTGLDNITDVDDLALMIRIKNHGMTPEQAKLEACQLISERNVKNFSKMTDNIRNNPITYKAMEKIAQEQINNISNTFNKQYHVYVGMTREEAEKAGGEILSDFNLVCPNGDIIENKDDITYARIRELEKRNISMTDVGQICISGTKNQKVQLYSSMLNSIADKNLATEQFKNVQTLDDLACALGIDKDTWAKLDNNERAQMLSTKFQEKLESIVTSTDVDSDLSKEMSRLLKGEWTEEEKACGHSGEIPGDECRKLATQNLTKRYIADISAAAQNIYKNGGGDEQLAVVIGVLKGIENDTIKTLLASIGNNSFKEEDSAQREIATAALAEETKNLPAGSFLNNVVTADVINYGSEETITNYLDSYKEDIEVIQSVVDAVLESMPESERKENLQTVIYTTIQNIIENTSPDTNSGSKQNTTTQNTTQKTTSTSVKTNTEQGQKTVTNPLKGVLNTNNSYTQDAGVAQVQNTKQSIIAAQKALYQEYISAPIEAAAPENTKLNDLAETVRKNPTQNTLNEYSKNIKTLYIKVAEELGLDTNKIQDTTPVAMANELFTLYDKMPDKMKLKFRSQLQAMSVNHLCEAYINGNNDMRKFMFKMQYINQETLNKYFDSHHAELKKAPINVQREYYTSKNEEMFKEFNKKKSSLADKGIKDYSDNWHVL